MLTGSNEGWLRALAFAVAVAVVEVAPALVPRRPPIAHVQRGPTRGRDDEPIPEIPSADDLRALYHAVGAALEELATREPAACAELGARYRSISASIAAFRHDPERRWETARALVALRHRLAEHAN